MTKCKEIKKEENGATILFDDNSSFRIYTVDPKEWETKIDINEEELMSTDFPGGVRAGLNFDPAGVILYNIGVLVTSTFVIPVTSKNNEGLAILDIYNTNGDIEDSLEVYANGDIEDVFEDVVD